MLPILLKLVIFNQVFQLSVYLKLCFVCLGLDNKDHVIDNLLRQLLAESLGQCAEVVVQNGDCISVLLNSYFHNTTVITALFFLIHY